MNELEHLQRQIYDLKARLDHLERMEGNTFSALTVTPGSIDLNYGSLYGDYVNIADDDFTTITPDNVWGAILLWYRSGDGAGVWLFGAYRASDPAWSTKFDGGSTTVMSTGALNGTTGVDGQFTVSPHTDGKIYLENRAGGTSIGVQILLLGR